MRLLLTNDDGISSPGLLLLAEGLRKTGHKVMVIAPAYDQSGVSHSISFLNRPCKLEKIDNNDNWSCDGTPVDCVIVALLGGFPEICSAEDMRNGCLPYDALVSGINKGANLGTDIIYSGTAAAARQGSLCNIPSLALSLVEADTWNWKMAVEFSVEHLEQMLANWKPDSFINVNIPNNEKKPSKLVHSFPSFRYYNDSIEMYIAPDNHRYCFARSGHVKMNDQPGSDFNAIANNCASLSEVCIHPVLLGGARDGKKK